MINTLKTKFRELKKKYLRLKAIREFKKGNLYSIEQERLMEQYATRQILAGSSESSVAQSRQVLVKHQHVIKVKEDFQDFLDSL